MSNHYAPLPNANPRTDPHGHSEMDAAFDDSDDEDATESHPLNPSRPSPPSPVSARTPGTYDFENVDYDYPPPGSPPRPSATALPNDYGNSNGLIPSFSLDTSAAAERRGWFRRTAASILPTHYVQRIWSSSRRPAGAIGGGTENDGVFANVTAKPTPPKRIQDGDETFMVPEDARPEAPPSYASAQQDAVPPYWENTVIAPFSPDALGEMIIDNLPTGSLFSFLWNMLVSISFQFVGFLLTYLLHTTHAARLGSRAGLGVTLIQYGFALRGRMVGEAGGSDDGDAWAGWRVGDVPPSPLPTPDTAAQAGGYYKNLTGDATNPTNTVGPDEAELLVADATTQWLSFFLMTVGWFILLTSLLGFWRVKRWERGIMTSQRESNPGEQNSAIVSQFERAFGIRGMSHGDLLRQGLGFGTRRRGELEPVREDEEHGDHEPVIPGDRNDPERASLIAQAYANERRLQEDLRAAGLL